MALTLEDIIHPLPAEPIPLDLAELFGNTRPVELEVGCGKGGFLLEQARQHPERNYLGIEWANKYCRYAADRMARWGLANVRLLRADAVEVLLRRVPPQSLSAVHVYHPDPWPKARHHKRRLFRPAVVERLVDILVDGGMLAVQTDHAEYFAVIHGLLEARSELEQVLRVNSDSGDDSAAGTVATNYQIKYHRAGRPIHRVVYRRRSRSGEGVS